MKPLKCCLAPISVIYIWSSSNVQRSPNAQIRARSDQERRATLGKGLREVRHRTLGPIGHHFLPSIPPLSQSICSQYSELWTATFLIAASIMIPFANSWLREIPQEGRQLLILTKVILKTEGPTRDLAGVIRKMFEMNKTLLIGWS